MKAIKKNAAVTKLEQVKSWDHLHRLLVDKQTLKKRYIVTWLNDEYEISQGRIVSQPLRTIQKKDKESQIHNVEIGEGEIVRANLGHGCIYMAWPEDQDPPLDMKKVRDKAKELASKEGGTPPATIAAAVSRNVSDQDEEPTEDQIKELGQEAHQRVQDVNSVIEASAERINLKHLRDSDRAKEFLPLSTQEAILDDMKILLADMKTIILRNATEMMVDEADLEKIEKRRKDVTYLISRHQADVKKRCKDKRISNMIITSLRLAFSRFLVLYRELAAIIEKIQPFMKFTDQSELDENGDGNSNITPEQVLLNDLLITDRRQLWSSYLFEQSIIESDESIQSEDGDLSKELRITANSDLTHMHLYLKKATKTLEDFKESNKEPTEKIKITIENVDMIKGWFKARTNITWSNAVTINQIEEHKKQNPSMGPPPMPPTLSNTAERGTTTEGSNSAVSGPSHGTNPQTTNDQDTINTNKSMTLESSYPESRLREGHEHYESSFLNSMQAEKQLRQKIQALELENNKKEEANDKILTAIVEQNKQLRESLNAEKRSRQEFEKILKETREEINKGKDRHETEKLEIERAFKESMEEYRKAQEEKFDNYFREHRSRSESRRKSMKEKYEESERKAEEKIENLKQEIAMIRKERSRSRSASTDKRVSFETSTSRSNRSPPPGSLLEAGKPHSSTYRTLSDVILSTKTKGSTTGIRSLRPDFRGRPSATITTTVSDSANKDQSSVPKPINTADKTSRSAKGGGGGGGGDDSSDSDGDDPPSSPPPGGSRDNVPLDPDDNILTILLDDAEERLRTYMTDMKITSDDIVNLTNDELKSLARHNLKSYETAAAKLQDMKLTIMLEKSKHRNLVHTQPRLNTRIHEVCQELVIFSNNLMIAKQEILNEARTRHIKLNKPDYDMKGILSLATFDGTGDSELHFYQWKGQLAQYLSDSNIPEESAGAVILKHLTGVARARILKFFPTNSNPNASVVLEHLRKTFGKPECILEQLINEVKSVGKIPTHLSAKWSEINQKAVKLTKILEKISNLNRHSNDIGDSSFELITALENTIPSDKIEDYNMNSTDKTNLEKLNLVKKILARAEESSLIMCQKTPKDRDEDINFTRVSVTDASKTPEPKPTENKPPATTDGRGRGRGGRTRGRGRGGQRNVRDTTPTKSNITYELKDDNELKCHICSRFKIYESKEVMNKKHLFSSSGNTLPESCPLLAGLNTREKRNLLEKYGICTVCCYNDITSSHDVNSCTHTTWYKSSKCSEDSCNDRNFVCVQHKDKNDDKLKKRQSQLKDAGVNIALITMEYDNNEAQPLNQETNSTLVSADYTEPSQLYPSHESMINHYESMGKKVNLEPKGSESYFIFFQFEGLDGLNYLGSWDTCSSNTIVTRRILGRGIAASEIDMPDRKSISGIGGLESCSNASILIPFINDEVEQAYAQVVSRILNSKHRNSVKHANLLNKMYPDMELTPTPYNTPIDILIGMKNFNERVAPKLIHWTSYGLAIYETRIQTKKGSNKTAYCFGGNMDVMVNLEDKIGKTFIAETISNLQSNCNPENIKADHLDWWHPINLAADEATQADESLAPPPGFTSDIGPTQESSNTTKMQKMSSIKIIKNQAFEGITTIQERILTKLLQGTNDSEHHCIINARNEKYLDTNDLDELNLGTSDWISNTDTFNQVMTLAMDSPIFRKCNHEDEFTLLGPDDSTDNLTEDKNDSPPPLTDSDTSSDESESDPEYNIPAKPIEEISRRQGRTRARDRVARRAVQNKKKKQKSSREKVVTLYTDEDNITSPDDHPSPTEHRNVEHITSRNCSCPHHNNNVSLFLTHTTKNVEFYLGAGMRNMSKSNLDLINQRISGNQTEREYKCYYCLSCKRCDDATMNMEASIEKLKQEKLFENKMRIDTLSKKLVGRYPVPDKYREFLGNNYNVCKRRLKTSLTNIAKFELSKEQVKQAWSKYRSRGFFKKKSELSKWEAHCVDREKVQYFIPTTLAFKPDSESSQVSPTTTSFHH